MRSKGHELFFYQAGKPASVLGDGQATRYVREDKTLLSDLTEGSAASLLATENGGTVLQDFKAGTATGLSYAPYGQRFAVYSNATQLGFNGEYLMPSVLMYLLGNGYRVFSPTLMRFYSADSFSPFRVLNSYGFCGGDPVNYVDPSGHVMDAKKLLKFDRKVKALVVLQEQMEGNAGVVRALPDNMHLEDAKSIASTARGEIHKLYMEGVPVKAWLFRKTDNSNYKDVQQKAFDVGLKFSQAFRDSMGNVNNALEMRHALWAANSANAVVDGKWRHLDLGVIGTPGNRNRLGSRTAEQARAEMERLRKTRVEPVP